MSSSRGGFFDWRSQMNRKFDEIFGDLARRPGRQLEEATQWGPALDSTVRDGKLIIRAEPPDVKQEAADVALHDNVLTISGERKAEQPDPLDGTSLTTKRDRATSGEHRSASRFITPGLLGEQV